MGRYNPDEPAILGCETPLYAMRTALLNNPTRAVAMQIKPGAVSADEVHRFLLEVAGQPGLALEIVPEGQFYNPPVVSTFLPGNDSDSVSTGYTDQGGGGVNSTDLLDRFSGATYARNAGAISTSATYPLLFPANNAGALAGRRITALHVGASVKLRNLAATATYGYLAGDLSIDGVQYVGPEKTFQRNDRITFLDRLGSWYLNPATNLPWSLTVVNHFLDPADNEVFGVRLRAQAAAQAVNIPGFYLEVEHGAENRYWAAYTNAQPRPGWHQEAMSSVLGAMAANQWYWLIMSCPWSTQSSWARIPILTGDATTPLAVDGADATREPRRTRVATLSGPAGTVVDYEGGVFPGFIPALIGNAGVINECSQAYADVDGVPVYVQGTANIGQQVFPPAAGAPHAMAGIGIIAAWGGGERPDAPLVIQVRSGVGAISGGGVLVATATLDPVQVTEQVQYLRVPFDGGAVNLSSQQYHVLLSSQASAFRPWQVFRGDTRSDYLQATPTTTLAEVEQQSFGRSGTATGQSDAYCEAGAALTRYDLMVQLLKAPTAPTGFAVTVLPAKVIERGAADSCDPTVLEPRIVASWNATALAANWRAYIVQRQLRAVPTPAWETVYERRPTSTETPATVEANELMFIDSEPGWSVVGGPNASGWNYRLVVEDHLGNRSLPAAQVVLGAQTVATPDSWMLSNAAWWLRTPIRVHTESTGGDADVAEVWSPIDRDGAVVRTPAHLPERRVKLSWSDLDYAVESRLAVVREAATAGRKMALLESRGDRYMGVPTIASRRRSDDRQTDYDCDFILTGRPVSDPVAGFNGPCEIMFDGATSYALTADDPTLNPGSTAFAVAICGRFAGAGSSKYVLSKGNLGTADGYAIRTTGVANRIELIVDGASTGVGGISTGAVVPELFTGTDLHVIWLMYTGAVLSLYIDDELAARATQAGAAGAITNNVGLAVAANNAGALSRGAHKVRAWGYWPAVPSTAARQMTARYMLGCYGQRAHLPASIFFDAADDRTWASVQTSLKSLAGAATDLPAALTGTWTRRGIPAPLSRLERWYAH